MCSSLHSHQTGPQTGRLAALMFSAGVKKKKSMLNRRIRVFPWQINSSCRSMINSSFTWNTEGLINRFYRYYSTLGMFERAICFASLRIRMEKFALKAGSSKQGKAARALVGSNCVEATTLKT